MLITLILGTSLEVQEWGPERKTIDTEGLGTTANHDL